MGSHISAHDHGHCDWVPTNTFVYSPEFNSKIELDECNYHEGRDDDYKNGATRVCGHPIPATATTMKDCFEFARTHHKEPYSPGLQGCNYDENCLMHSHKNRHVGTTALFVPDDINVVAGSCNDDSGTKTETQCAGDTCLVGGVASQTCVWTPGNGRCYTYHGFMTGAENAFGGDVSEGNPLVRKDDGTASSWCDL